MKALDESVVIEVAARRPGEEQKTASGIVIGVEKVGEIPTYGTIVAIGRYAEGKEIELGDVVLIPQGRMQNVPDPKVVDGELADKSPKARQLVATHWKNIQVNYGKKNA